MPATTNKQRVLSHLLAAVKSDREVGEPLALPVLEQFVYGLCREGATREHADQAYRNLQEHFFDWNEVRVSSVRELEESLSCLPGAEARAERLVSFLQEVFETTYSFNLEPLQKKGVKQAAKQLSRYQAANDYVVSWVIQQTLGGHAIPIDAPTLRTSRRLGLLEDEQEDAEALRASLEHLVPKARGPLFSNLISIVADENCWPEAPNCPTCPMLSECPTGQDLTPESVPVGRSARKPR